MDKEKAIGVVRKRAAELSQLGCDTADNDRFRKWQRITRVDLQNIFGGESPQVEEFGELSFFDTIRRANASTQYSSNILAYQRGISKIKAFLETVAYEIENYRCQEQEVAAQNNPVDIVSLLFDRFHSVVRQLQIRRQNRATISIEDEYDVQDLLHALLKIHFDDVRPEEWTGRYAGKSSRMDFLLKREKLVIEVKKTREGLTAKEIGDQLIVDIERYAEHPDCKNLLCFVYDPDNLIGNPTGLESDLRRSENGLSVLVFIRPKSS